jgi:hypothetical protein
MDVKAWDFMAKKHWPPGPWQDEPDAERWTDEETGLPCLILRNELGSLCGYVGLSEGHPWHGKSCWDIETGIARDLTFSESCNHGVWWVGFHCAYTFDLSPLFLMPPVVFPERLREMQTYRTIGYVRAVCKQLALEAKNALSNV